jgi:hypothetical protein
VTLPTTDLAGAYDLNYPCDIAYANGYVCVLWSAGVAAIVDPATGAVIRPPELALASALYVAAYGNIFIVMSVSSSANIPGAYLDTTSRSTINTGWVSMGNVITDHVAVGGLGFAITGLSDCIACVYASGTANTTKIKLVTTAGVIDTASLTTTITTTTQLAIGGTGGSSASGTLWVAWDDSSTTVRVAALDPSTMSVTGTATNIITTSSSVDAIGIVEGSTATQARVVAQDISRVQLRGATISAGAVATNGSQATLRGSRMGGLPFRVGSRYYLPFYQFAGQLQFVDITETAAYVRAVANIYPDLVATVAAGFHRTAHTAAGASSTARYHAIHKKLVSHVGAQDGDTVGAVELAKLDFASRDRWQPATHAGTTYLSGGVPSLFDGQRVVEAGILHSPSLGVDVSSGTGMTLTTGRSYVAVYEDLDATGELVTSGVSTAVATGEITNKAITITVNCLSVGVRAATCYVAVYATTDGGSTYHRLDRARNDPATGTVAFSDTAADATISICSLLYGTGSLPGTNGSGQDRRAPPHFHDIVSFAGMLIGCSGPDLWWSSQHILGEGLWFNPLFQLPVEDGEGDVTALEVMDGTMFAFKRRSIYTLAGDTTNDAGTVGGLGSPRRLASNVGCVEVNSVVVTSAGIFFQSERGIELLNRGGAVTWVGEAIQDTLASFPVVSSAVLDDRNGLVRFSLAGAESGGLVSGSLGHPLGRDVVYDLSTNQWVSVDDKLGAIAFEASQDACMLYVEGAWRYAWLSTEGSVFVERLPDDASAHLDGSTWVTMQIETGWFKAGGIQGRQMLSRVLVLARKATEFDLAMSLGYNYSTSYKTARTWTKTEIEGLLSDGWPITQLKHDAHDDAECQAVRVKLVDATPTSGTVGSGKGASWIALTLDITPQQGAFEVPEEAA